MRGMIWKKKKIHVRVKLYGGLHKEAAVEGYNQNEGHMITIPKGSRVLHAVKLIGLPHIYSLAYFCNGKRVGVFKKLHEGDELSCLRPSGGG